MDYEKELPAIVIQNAYFVILQYKFTRKLLVLPVSIMILCYPYGGYIR